MKLLKKLDFYRKYTNEDQTPTLLGAWLSVAAICLTLIFVSFEVSGYLLPHLTREVIVNTSPKNASSSQIPMNLKIEFTGLPCRCKCKPERRVVLRLLQRDTFGLKMINMSTLPNIKLQRLKEPMTRIADSYISPMVLRKYSQMPAEAQRVLTQVLEHEGCQIIGSIDIYKFFVTATIDELAEAKISLSDIIPDLTFTHKIHEVSFGSKAAQTELARMYLNSSQGRRFGNSRATIFNKADDIEKQTNVTSCFYYLKAVQNSFYMGKQQVNHEAFKYSINLSCDNKAQTIGGYNLALVYDISAVGITYKREEYSLSQVFTAISAIVAGVYVIFKQLHNFLSTLL